ncbi:4'-phosphopantetheinyl transferase [Streptomyces sp. cf386]|uniref:4'-phosphopantetheinyl transferase family protein n=1 Tax=Streptomyces sp. cf386 TaxID=1761904 RepID=UPI000881E55C|nr:4'-phosphopantetheinyl transferase superfamily protein [Streptomyces sp. cf386]SDO52241.1 4'-phosphopantetheinyl transferase [Streptomyces sp. cf386]
MTPLLAVAPGQTLDVARQVLRRYGSVVVHADVADWAVRGEAEAVRWLGRERGRLDAALPAAARQRLVASRRLVKSMAGAVLGVEPGELELTRDPAGRPRLRGCGGLELSLSHTDTRLVLALAVAGGQVGADVERATRPVRVELLARRICTPYERAVLNATSPAERPRTLLRLWTLKEAYTKALGVGTRLPFHTFGFRLHGRGAVLTDDRGRPVRPSEWRFTTHHTDTGHLVSLAVAGPPDSLRFPPPGLPGNLQL